MPNMAAIAAALFGGFISFVSPCVLPLVPAYITFVSGVSIDELRNDSGKRRHKKVLYLSLSFVLGFSVVFIALGAALAGLFAAFFKQPLFYRTAGLILIFFGMHIAGAIPVKFLNYEKRLNFNPKEVGLGGAFLIGLSFALGWSPCIGPILAGILFIAGVQGGAAEGMMLLTAYSLGLGIPFVLTALATDKFMSFSGFMRKHYKAIEIISGVFLIVVGVMIFFNLFYVMTLYFTKLFPWLTSIG
ncbi:MAG: cytochrome c biogenesis protein CcdA [Candidatus Marinimicrobia bacterium]|nr:cytochrome c biogenesis protein CcdA [Candidatus Neomarinimicrobiota bacterium]